MRSGLFRRRSVLKVSEQRPDGESHGAVERKKEATEQEYEFGVGPWGDEADMAVKTKENDFRVYKLEGEPVLYTELFPARRSFDAEGFLGKAYFHASQKRYMEPMPLATEHLR